MCHARYEKSLKKTHPRVVAKKCVETYSSPVFHILYYGRIPITRTFEKGNIKQFELSRVKLNRKQSEGNENCFELAGGSSYRGFELPGDDCITGENHSFYRGLRYLKVRYISRIHC